MDKEFAQKFAREWVEAWNSHNLDKILTHYADDFEMNSPIIQQLVKEPSGCLKGKDAVRAYWSKALEMYPNLHFELLNIFLGVNSIVVNYKGHRGPAAEIFYFNAGGKVAKAYAHYE
ncbi:MAG: nuclear transport factor 2 family protein [Gammaproteobacteria bacterium]|nr:nuclear transport factor 2 family protein [Gammaproteobacteria bacterium]